MTELFGAKPSTATESPDPDSAGSTSDSAVDGSDAVCTDVGEDGNVYPDGGAHSAYW